MFRRFLQFFLLCMNAVGLAAAVNPTDNQTGSLSTIVQNPTLPFDVLIEEENFMLPNGVHSGAWASYNGKWLFITGRTNGMHSFNLDNNNFPPAAQNQLVYVVDPSTGITVTRSLTDPSSGLNQQQIDFLSVTSPQSYQPSYNLATLYITGGYGVDTSNGEFSTKPVLTAIDLPGLMNWVTNPSSGETAAQHIRQVLHPIFQITGGYMDQVDEDHPTLLIFGQNFLGFYLPFSNGQYSEQVRRFDILDNGPGSNLSVKIIPLKPSKPDADYRRRDLNIVPVVLDEDGHEKKGFVAFSGVFTVRGGIWTVPVEISANGKASMDNPLKPGTFKQGMNNYICPTLKVFSKALGEMYTVFFGGISYGFFVNRTFQVDSEIPFINQVTAIKIDKHGHYTQYLLNTSYPVILSTESNPGNVLLFGAGGRFIVNEAAPIYNNTVVNVDALAGPIVIGHIVGGIQSTLPNTNVASDSAASPYVFKVTLIPRL